MLGKAKIVAALAKAGVAAKGFIILHAPAALVAAGVGLVVWAIVETAKAASEPNDELEQAVEDLEDASDVLVEAKELNKPLDYILKLKKEKKAAFRKCIKEFVRQYKKPIIIATFGISCIVGGYLWVAKRFAIAAAEAAAASATLATLDHNCRKMLGDDITNAMYSKEFDETLYSYKSERIDPETGETTEISRVVPESKFNSAELIGPDDDPINGFYHYNKTTVDRGKWNNSFEWRIMNLKFKLAELQDKLDNDPEVTMYTKQQLLRAFGLTAATYHKGDKQGELEADLDLTTGVCKGDTIDIGLGELFDEFGDVRDANKMAYLEEKYGEDIIFHLNCTHGSVKRAVLLAGTGAPKYFEEMSEEFRQKGKRCYIPDKIWNLMMRRKTA